MHIKRVNGEGFKVYKNRFSIELGPNHNCVVGANGSGKSNLFACVQFALDAVAQHLSQSERKSYLHEGAGSVMSAYVEIVFDNTDGRIPIDKEEVVIKRWIALKKDQYYIDRKEATRSEVISLLETCGLSRANPYNIVPQGKVDKLTSAKEDQRLAMIKDVAGVKVYDDRKAESMKTMTDANGRIEKIDDHLTTIHSRLAELATEKDELAQYQELDKKRKVAEYTYYQRELKKAKAEIVKAEAERAEASERAAQAAGIDADLSKDIQEHEKRLKQISAELKLAGSDHVAKKAEHKELLAQVAKLEMAQKQARDDVQKRMEQQKAATSELAEIDEHIRDVDARLASEAPLAETKADEAAAAAREVERVEAALQQLHSKESGANRFGSKKERDKHLAKEVAELSKALEKKEAQASTLQKEMDAAKAELTKADKKVADRRKIVSDSRSKALEEQQHCARLRAERDEATDERKRLWRSEADLRRERKAAEEELEKAQRTLSHSMSRTQCEAVDACRRIVREKRIKGVHGMLIELLECDAKFNTAVDVAAGNQLFQMVVDTDATAATLVEELKKANAGRVTFMPLNRLQSREPEDPPGLTDDCMAFVPKTRALLGLRWKDKGERVPMGEELVSTALSVALRKKVEFTEAELRKFDLGKVSLDSYVKVAADSGVRYFKPAPMVLQFDEKFRPAINQVFRKTLLVRSLEVGTAKAREFDVDCITLDGDQVNRKGTLSGGFLEARKSRVGAQAAIGRLQATLDGVDASLTQLEGEKKRQEAAALETLSQLQKHERAAQMAVSEAELEANDMSTGATGGSSGSGTGASRDAHRAANAQKESALKALQAAAQSDRDRVQAVQAELRTPFESELSAAERAGRTRLQEQLRELQKARDAAATESAKAQSDVGSLRASLSEHLRKRQDELHETLGRLTGEADEAGGDEGAGSAAEQLQAVRERLAAVGEALSAAAEECDTKREDERKEQSRLDAAKTKATTERSDQSNAAKRLDVLLNKKAMMQSKAEEFEQCIRKLGTLPQAAYDARGDDVSLSSKQLQAKIDRCAKELSGLGHVNKKALDQYGAFADEKQRLQTKYKELEKSRDSIVQLIDHLDNLKDAAIERTFKGVASNFTKSFKELVAGGSGKLVMVHNEDLPANADAATRVQNYIGVSIKVRFPGQGDATTMQQLSGGQKTMVALCIIFAIQRCDPAPFYIFDEIDAALDATHRSALAAMIQKQAHALDEDGKEAPTQFVTTTFRPELIKAADRHFGVTHAAKVSTIKPVEGDEALRIIATEDRRKQHAGGAGIGIGV